MSELGNINIKPEELRNLANTIANIESNLNQHFQDIWQRMLTLNQDGWSSQAGNDLRDRFQSLHNSYMNVYPPAMQQYIQFLNNSATEYENEEAARAAAAANLANTVH
jgi:WXG100 family type VII secretion target